MMSADPYKARRHIGEPGNKYWAVKFARDRYLAGFTTGDQSAMEMSCAIGDLLRAVEKELA